MYKKVNYASVVLDQNGYSNLKVVFDELPRYYDAVFTKDELATMDNGSYFIMDNGLANSCSVYNGKAGLTYAYVLNGQSSENRFIDIDTYCRGASHSFIGVSVKQITVDFAEQILKDFNLPFRIAHVITEGKWVIVPTTLDRLVGTYVNVDGDEVRVTGYDKPEYMEAYGRLMLRGINSKTGRMTYFRLTDIPEYYPGHFGRDHEFEIYGDKLN